MNDVQGEGRPKHEKNKNILEFIIGNYDDYKKGALPASGYFRAGRLYHRNVDFSEKDHLLWQWKRR